MLDLTRNPWIADAKVGKILCALPAGSTRFVGGCVRNALWSLPVRDIDLATSLEPEAVTAALRAAKIKTVPTGLDHGTVTAVVDGTPFEITSLRRDVETDGRRAVVTFTKDWAQDAQRRDLTINALYADADGHVYDPTHEGLDDIAARRFRFVGNADLRVREDYLRILRYFRFIAWYGNNAKLDADALKACREHKAGLKTLSVERIWSEIKKTLSAPNPNRALRIMLTNDILDKLLPEASNVEGLERLIKVETDFDITPDPMLRLMAMSARDEMALAGLAKRLKMSGTEKTRLLGWAGDLTNLSPLLSDKDRKIVVYNSTAQVIHDRAALRMAGEDDPVLQQGWAELARFALSWERPVFPVKGRDLKAAGIKDGPAIGRALKALEALWIRSGFTTDKPRLLLALKILGL